MIQFDGKSGVWMLRNVGYGPALNIIVAQQSDEDDQWYNPVLLPAVGAGDSFALEWLGRGDDFSLGVQYEGVLADRRWSRFFTHARHDRCEVYRLREKRPQSMPDYPFEEVRRHWQTDLPSTRTPPACREGMAVNHPTRTGR